MFSNSIITADTSHRTNVLVLTTPQQSEITLLSGVRVTQNTGGADGVLQTELVAVPRAGLVFLALGLSPVFPKLYK